ncbi:ABC transporter ATP-binding protein [Novosphingobium sp. BL-8A]|uniref:ABC transporter ATP-binding protein n=1 Tax=Novosphingobium sp. BL-8A TaxID=3127639 RepID=UPI003757AA52
MILSRQARPDTASTPAPLDIRAVSKGFAGPAVLDGVSLAIEPGERIALLGPSGSGKSTLLNLVAGFEQPDQGDICIDGRSIVALPVHARQIGMVFQHYALFPHLSVAENIAYPLVRRRASRAETRDRVDRLLASVRLQGFADRRIHTLSGGQQQRVAIARALAAEPAVLLMDEPMGALDRALREQLQIELKLLLQQTRSTVIYVTHDQREALALADRIAIMNEGRLEQVGAVEDIYGNPASAFAAEFLWAGANRLGAMTGQGGKVHLCGVPLDARWPGLPPVTGSPAALVVRPEDVSFHERRDGALAATVLTALFAGTHRIVQLELPSGEQLNAVQPISDLAPTPGTAVGVTIYPGAACAYPVGAR